jgi:hypothetical protein
MEAQRRVFLTAALIISVCCSWSLAAAQSPDPKLIEGAKKEGQMVFYTTMTLDQSLSKEGQEMLRGMQRIPVRKDVEPDPPRLFRGYKRVVENPEDYKDFEGLVKLYNSIFKLR